MIKRKDKILISAIELMDEGGVNNLTTKNLALVQGVSEPALYRQFKGKLDIITNIIEEYASYDEKITNTILQSEMKGKEAILFYVKRYGELYQNYAELTTIMFSMDIYEYEETTKVLMHKIMSDKVAFLEKILKGEIVDSPYDYKDLARIINGLIFSLCYQWRMDDKRYLLEEKLVAIISKLV